MPFCIYIIHNLVNNKIYVGKSKNPKHRWIKHCRIANGKRNKEKFYLQRAISKYGKNNFTFTVIQKFKLEINANLAETYWISYFKSNDKDLGYNLTDGGEGASGRKMSREAKDKIRQKALGRKHTKDTILKMSGNNNHGSKITENDVIKIREMFATRKYTMVELGRMFGLSPKGIKHIIVYNTWKHVRPDLKKEYKRLPKPQSVRDKFSEINKEKCKDPKYREKISKYFGEPKRGEQCFFSKLSEKEVLEIRERYKQGGITHRKLAEIYNVTKTTIGDIIRRKIWKHI